MAATLLPTLAGRAVAVILAVILGRHAARSIHA